jgi:CspA family cold shock protein
VSTNTRTYTGVVKWFGGNGGNYGFITSDAGGPEMFVHISAVGAAGLREIKQGDRLEYTFEPDPKNGKMGAVNLKLI